MECDIGSRSDFDVKTEDLEDACRDPLHSSLGCISNLLVGAPIHVKKEAYKATAEWLADLIGSSELEPVRRRMACRIAVTLTTKDGMNYIAL